MNPSTYISLLTNVFAVIDNKFQILTLNDIWHYAYQNEHVVKLSGMKYIDIKNCNIMILSYHKELNIYSFDKLERITKREFFDFNAYRIADNFTEEYGMTYGDLIIKSNHSISNNNIKLLNKKINMKNLKFKNIFYLCGKYFSKTIVDNDYLIEFFNKQFTNDLSKLLSFIFGSQEEYEKNKIYKKNRYTRSIDFINHMLQQHMIFYRITKDSKICINLNQFYNIEDHRFNKLYPLPDIRNNIQIEKTTHANLINLKIDGVPILNGKIINNV